MLEPLNASMNVVDSLPQVPDGRKDSVWDGFFPRNRGEVSMAVENVSRCGGQSEADVSLCDILVPREGVDDLCEGVPGGVAGGAEEIV